MEWTIFPSYPDIAAVEGGCASCGGVELGVACVVLSCAEAVACRPQGAPVRAATPDGRAADDSRIIAVRNVAYRLGKQVSLERALLDFDGVRPAVVVRTLPAKPSKEQTGDGHPLATSATYNKGFAAGNW
jgi:hypothetical protein